jgi:hypothetical protein
VALLSGKCDGSAVEDCIEHDIFVRQTRFRVLKLQISNIASVLSGGMGLPRNSDASHCHKCQLQFLLLHLTSNNGRVSCLYERYASRFWLIQFKGALMTTIAMPRRRKEIENEEYRQRMVVNALAASFITLMIVTGFWIVNTLVQVS